MMSSRVSLLLICLLASLGARAQQGSLATSVKRPVAKSPWSGELSYDVVTDLADERSSRTYTHGVHAGVGYELIANWTVSAGLRADAQTVDGKIPKEQEKSHVDTLAPSADVGVEYADKFGRGHSYGLGVTSAIPISQDERFEGYRAVVSEYAMLSLELVAQRLKLTQLLSATQIDNTFRQSTDGTANPDAKYAYRAGLGVVLGAGFSAGVSFVVRATHHLDGYWGYSYGHEISLKKTWNAVTASLGYSNGGLTDDGRVRLLFVDDYRRVVSAKLLYTF